MALFTNINEQVKEISLREASKLSGYSSDYIGSLIRNEQIYGRRIVGTSAWVTTEEAVLEYAKSNRGARSNSARAKAFARYDAFHAVDEIQTKMVKNIFLISEIALSVLVLFIFAMALYLFQVFSVASSRQEARRTLERLPLQTSPRY